MGVFRPSASERGSPLNPPSSADPRLQPTPDYGTLGPGRAWRRPLFAFAIGTLLAILTANAGQARTAWSHFKGLFSLQGKAVPLNSAKDVRQLDRLKPQKQAEALLELAVGRSDGAVEQISSRVDRWQGKLNWNSQIATLTSAALNSNDMRVRESGIEVELAAYGLAKNSASLNYLRRAAASPDHAQKVWALWALGLMANRGVETESVAQALAAHLKDSDEDSRRWAVEGLALTGASEAIPALLTTLRSDPAPSVRERAACALAESGMFSSEQRLSAVPQLLNYTDDPAIDAQTHAWAFQALSDITHQRLPNDSAAWRSWYENSQN